MFPRKVRPVPGPKRQPVKSTTARKNTPARKSAASKPASGRATRAPARRKSAAVRSRPRQSVLSRISRERWFDITGVVLTLAGLLTMLGLLSPQRSDGLGSWINAVATIAGWGSIVLPVGLILAGIWMVLRNVERLPAPSIERMTGIVLLYLNILAWMHLIGPEFTGISGWALAAAGQGGGYIGGIFEQITTTALGALGAYVVFIGWSLIALALTFDVSVSEIFHFLQQALASLVRRINHQLSEGSQARAERRAIEQARSIPELDAYGQPKHPQTNGAGNLAHARRAAPSSDLPPEFSPMPGPADTQPPPGDTLPGRPAQPGTTAAASAAENVPSRSRVAQHGRRSQVDDAAAQTLVPRPVQLPPWKLPPIDNVLDAASPVSAGGGKEDAKLRGRLIEETLGSFGCPVEIVDISTGPTVTQFGVKPLFVESRSGTKTRVRVAKIASLADDLALALAAPRIRIQAPVPGRSYVGIEVPNLEISRVTLRDVMESEGFRKLKSPLRFALGKDVAGNAKSYDLASMPHLLIAGTTGSGKSVCVNALLSCLLINNTPTDLRMILVDPKRVELTGYNGIPHLLAPVIVEAEEVVGALQWVQREMDARYHRFSQVGARNIADYNARYSPPLPYMLVLVDELADLMMLAPDETERALTRLAQLARATGIHLVLATQRPSVDVVTGLIKANFPARVAFAVASGTDSRVILDSPGAERLLGRGDMLFQAPDAAAPVRLQGVYVSDGEIQDLVEYWRQQAFEMRDKNLQTPTATPVNMDLQPSTPLKQGGLFGDDGGKGDPITNEAIRIVRTEGKASISMLQRKLRIGYTRAARLIDQLEEQGIVGPSVPTSQVREVLDFGDENTNDAEVEDSLS